MPLIEPTPYHRFYGGSNPTISETAVNRTYGVDFLIAHPTNVLGIRTYTHVSGAHDLTFKIWPRTAGAALKSKTLNVTGPGVVTCLFDSPLAVTASDIDAAWSNRWKASVYKPVAQSVTSCSNHDIFDGNTQAGHLGCRVVTDLPNFIATGDAYPSSLSTLERFPVDVIVQVPDTPVGNPDQIYDPTPFSYVYGKYNSSITERTSIDSTVGCGFFVVNPCLIRGVQFYDHLATSHQVKATLWHPDGTLLRDKTETIGAGTPAEWREIAFASAYEPSDADIADQVRNPVRPFLVGVYKIGQNSHTKANATKFFQDPGGLSDGQATIGARHHQRHPGYSSNNGGDAIPSTYDETTEYYPVDPMITQITESV